MNLTVNLDSGDEVLAAIELLKRFLPAQKEEKPELPFSFAEPAKYVEPEQPEQMIMPEFKEAPAPKNAGALKDDIYAIALALSKAGKQPDLARVFGMFGAKKLSGIQEKDYPACLEELRKIPVENVSF